MPDRPDVGCAGAKAVFEPLRALLGERFSTGQAMRYHHSHGEGLPTVGMPDAVVFPATNEEVAAIVTICRDAVVPIVGFGAGTSLEGHVAAVHGGVCVDFSTMNRILDVSPTALDCRVQAGVTWQQLNTDVRSHGLFFPVDPGAEATLAGMAATRASGTMAVRYGTMRRNVLGLTVVTADGRLIHTGGRARKSAAGLDLTRLFVGSEGTLGLITEVQLRLYGLPETITAAVCQFETLRGAIETVVTALQFGVPLARVELMTELRMRICISYAALNEFEAKPTLFLEFHGSPVAVRDQVETMQALCAENGGAGFRFAEQPEDRTRLWKARHDNYYATLAYAPGKKGMSTDACVPISESMAASIALSAAISLSLSVVVSVVEVCVEAPGIAGALCMVVLNANATTALMATPAPQTMGWARLVEMRAADRSRETVLDLACAQASELSLNMVREAWNGAICAPHTSQPARCCCASTGAVPISTSSSSSSVRCWVGEVVMASLQVGSARPSTRGANVF